MEDLKFDEASENKRLLRLRVVSAPLTRDRQRGMHEARAAASASPVDRADARGGAYNNGDEMMSPFLEPVGPVQIFDAEHRTPSPAKRATAQAWDAFDTDAMVQEILTMNQEKGDQMKWRAEFEHEKLVARWKKEVQDIMDMYQLALEQQR